MLDRININIDTICDEKEASENAIDGTNVSSWNKTPTITKLEVRNYNLIFKIIAQYFTNDKK